MANVTSSLVPGIYDGAKTATLSFSSNVASVAVTVNSAPPSISKYIAYDTLVPPNPFIAVTEDGRGKVVYDGGFPKFYNGVNPPATSFAELLPGCKYLYNAINWVANAAKVLAGNNKVLFIGDATDDSPYPLKGTVSEAFQKTFTTVANIAAKVPTFMSASEFANTLLDPSLATLEQYPVIVFLSSAAGNPNALITPAAVANFVKYRENGGGLIFITDHGYVLNSIEDIHAEGYAFFRTANAIIYNFGAYFTGDYQRTPVNVGFLRANYGDHPLYAGMSDSENIYAGDSESKVMVTTAVLVLPNQIQSILLNKQGTNTINVLMKLQDGTVDTQTFTYGIQVNDFVYYDTFNYLTQTWETNSGSVFADISGQMDMSVALMTNETLGDVYGELVLRGKRVGEVYSIAGVNNVTWYAIPLGRIPVMPGDLFEIKITKPFVKTISGTIRRQTLAPVNSISLFKNLNSLIFGGVIPESTLGRPALAIKAFMAKINTNLPQAGRPGNPTNVSKAMALARDYAELKLQLWNNPNLLIYQTTANALVAVAATPVKPGVFIVDYQANTIYGYLDGVIKILPGLKLQDIFGAPRVFGSIVDGGGSYRTELNGILTKL